MKVNTQNPKTEGWTREKIEHRPTLGWFVGRVRYPDGKRSAWTKLAREHGAAVKEYDRWMRTGDTPLAERGTATFRTMAEELIADEINEEKTKDRAMRLRTYAYPKIGMVSVAELGADHVKGVMEAMAELGKSAAYIDKMRADISQVLDLVVGSGVVAVNVAKHLRLPKKATIDTRPRTGLTDEQHVRFHMRHGYNHPIAMALMFCRCIAGHRTSDINAADWRHINTVDFSTMQVRRPKTDGEVGQKTTIGKAKKARAYEWVTHEVDESLRPLIREYWVAQGKPTRGPVFPLLRPGRAGAVRLKDGRVVTRGGGEAGGKRGKGSSFAKVLRRMVWEAGIYTPDPEQDWDPEAPDPSKCLLQTDTARTRRLTFQEVRMELATALADEGVPTVTQLAVTGHTQLSTVMKHYLKKRTVRVPKAALPGAAPEAPVAPLPTAAEHALQAALAAQTAALTALSAQVAALSAGGASPAAIPGNPQTAGINRSKTGLRVVR